MTVDGAMAAAFSEKLSPSFELQLVRVRDDAMRAAHHNADSENDFFMSASLCFDPGPKGAG